MTSLHETDLSSWAKQQSFYLVEREFEKLDVTYLLEELDLVSKSDQHALYSYLVVLMTHLLKIKYQPERVCNSWLASCSNVRGGIRKILKRHPSYQSILLKEIEDAYETARENAIYETGAPSSLIPIENIFDVNDLLIHPIDKSKPKSL